MFGVERTSAPPGASVRLISRRRLPVDLPQEALGVDDVLEDLPREDDVGRLVSVGKAGGQHVSLEEVDEVLERREAAGASLIDLRGVDLDAAEPDPGVLAEALQQK